FLADRSFTLLFVGDAATSVCCGMIALLALPHGIRSKAKGEPTGAALRHALSNPPFAIFMLAALCVTWIEYQIVTTLPLHVRDLGFPASTFGFLISANGLLVATFELALTGLTKRFAPQPVIALGFVLFAGGFA